MLAVDIQSGHRGAVLGDRIRMQQHADDPMVFIRSMATRGQQGPDSRHDREALRVIGAASYDVILVETVGVGQNELRSCRLLHRGRSRGTREAAIRFKP